MATYQRNVSGNKNSNKNYPIVLNKNLVSYAEQFLGCNHGTNHQHMLPCRHVLCDKCTPFRTSSAPLTCPICKELQYLRFTSQGILNSTGNVTKSHEPVNAMQNENAQCSGVSFNSLSTISTMPYDLPESFKEYPFPCPLSSLPLTNGSSKLGPIGSERKTPPQSPLSIASSLSNQINHPFNICTSPKNQNENLRNCSISAEAINETLLNLNALNATLPKTPKQRTNDVLNLNQFSNSSPFNPSCYSDWRNSIQIPSCAHQPPMEYYCFSCAHLLCCACLQNHKDHNCEPLEGIEGKLVDDLQKFLKQSEKIESDNNYVRNEIKNISNEMKNSKRQVIDEIFALIHNLLQIISSREKSLVEEVENAFEYKMELLRSRQQMLNNIKDTVVNIKVSMESMSERTSIDELTRLEIHLKEEVKKLNLPNLDSLGEDFVKYKSNSNDICEMIRTFGSFRCTPQSSYTVVSGLATQILVLNQKNYFTVTCFDHSRQRKKSGIEEITASIKFPNGNTVSVNIKDLNYGVYQGEIFTSLPGEHCLKISSRGVEIANPVHKPVAIERRGINDIITTGSTIFGKDSNAELSLIRGWGIHCDKDGTIYVTDKERHCVFVFSHELKFVKRFGKHGHEDGELFRPNGITVDRDNRIIIADKDNHRIQLFSTDGDFLMKIGKRGEAAGQFHYPWDVATNSRGDIAVSDSEHNRIQLFDKFGNLIILNDLRRIPSGIGKAGPRGICFDGDDAIFITEFQKNFLARFEINRESKAMNYDWSVGICSKFTEDLDSFRRFQGKIEKCEGEFDKPQGILISEGHILIAEAKNKRIVILSVKELYKNRKNNYRKNYVGKYTILKMVEYGDFEPCNIAMTPDGYLLVLDKNAKIYKFSAKSSLVRQCLP